MITSHLLCCDDGRDLFNIPDESIHLIVTSPPYPMIAMWDDDFGKADPLIAERIEDGDGRKAFEAMHRLLDAVWRECFRVAVPGGIVCINIGDATRSVDGEFRLYANHARVITFMEALGFWSLPLILWRKQTNAPNKFMGSGMLPGGAYITLEHEYILVFRKGGKRVFSHETSRALRRRSALFWEERNTWFSDVWDFKGARQSMLNGSNKNLRARSAAFPFELAYRLIHMYSLQGERVLDPFVGTGTTIRAAITGGRNSFGYDTDQNLISHILETLPDEHDFMNEYNCRRLERHAAFMANRHEEKGVGKKPGKSYVNKRYRFPVVTAQEREIELPVIDRIERSEGVLTAYYQSDRPVWERPEEDYSE